MTFISFFASLDAVQHRATYNLTLQLETNCGVTELSEATETMFGLRISYSAVLLCLEARLSTESNTRVHSHGPLTSPSSISVR